AILAAEAPVIGGVAAAVAAEIVEAAQQLQVTAGAIHTSLQYCVDFLVELPLVTQH
ncbi:unnamed protein product, partial [Callosobruchus maculatus]